MKKQKIKLTVLALSVLAFVTAVLWPTRPMDAAETRGAYNTFQMTTGLLSYVPTGATDTNYTNTTISGSLAVEVSRDSGLAIIPTFAASAMSGGTNHTVTFRLAMSNVADTNVAYYTTVATNLAFAFQANGSSTVRGYVHFSAAQLNNIKRVRLMSVEITGGTNSIYLTNVVASKYFPP